MKKELVSLLSNDTGVAKQEEENLATTKGDSSDVQIEYQRAANEKLKEEIRGLKQDREQRKVFSYCIFGFMCFYMLIALIIVFFSGLKLMALSDTVLVTLISSTLADVIGVFLFVAKYLFHNK